MSAPQETPAEDGPGAADPYTVGTDTRPASEWLRRAEADRDHWIAGLRSLNDVESRLYMLAFAQMQVELWERIVFRPAHAAPEGALRHASREALRQIGRSPGGIAGARIDIERGRRDGARDWLKAMHKGGHLTGVVTGANIVEWL